MPSRLQRSRWRRLAAGMVVVTWALGITTLVAGLGGGCPVSGGKLTAAEGRGWTLHYVFSTADPDGGLLAERLVQRGRLEALATEVTLPAGSAWSPRLAASGWKAREATWVAARGPSPRLEILNAQGVAVWSGPLPPRELSVPGAILLDEELAARVIRGEPAPRMIPVGCGPGA